MRQRPLGIHPSIHPNIHTYYIRTYTHTYIPSAVALTNLALCRRSAFMCFAFTTAIIFLYSINRLACQMVSRVLCLKKRESLYSVRLILLFNGGAMSREVSRLPLTVEVRVRSRAKPCETCGDSVAVREVSLRGFPFSYQYCSTSDPYLAEYIYIYIHTHTHTQRVSGK